MYSSFLYFRHSSCMPTHICSQHLRRTYQQDGKHHLKLALKAQTHEGFPIIPTSQLPASKSFQIYALQQDLNMGAIGPDVRPFRMPCHGKSRVSYYDDRLAQLYQKGGETQPMLYRFLEPKSIQMPAKASQQPLCHQEEQETSQGILPSIGMMYNADDNPNVLRPIFFIFTFHGVIFNLLLLSIFPLTKAILPNGCT